MQPTSESRQDVTAKFALDHLLGFVSHTYTKCDHAKWQSFYKAISRHAWFGTSAGCILETHVLLWFRYTPAQDCLQCTHAVDSLPLLDIPVCGKNMVFFSKASDLKDIDEHECPKCLVSVSQTFPTCDAIVLTNNFVITVQMTTTSECNAKNIGFEEVYECLPSKFLDKCQRCHVFLTDTEAKVDLLREQKLMEMPEKMTIHVYSAFFNIDQWDSILTKEHVEELDNDIVSRY